MHVGRSASAMMGNCAEVRDETGRVIHYNPRGSNNIGIFGSLAVTGGHTY